MKAIEFKSKIKNNRIDIPYKLQSILKGKDDATVRIIVLIDDVDCEDDHSFNQATQNQFLEGYSDSDSVYDDL
ncbi:hypothetical protein G3O08_15540 [Cryomorpha ignava]|uniref:Uncharacterized protein n=1 Tax=Cryomorpha ignava TaxID=101383 RepID=A0A7K3WT90_9FLAO|nr:hypothetical protein [Cryomorpha ignava]NEN24913.1 hypothetical protein [Cryomorpha ignava]